MRKVLVIAVLAALGAPVQAQMPDCAAQAQLVAEAVSMRQSGEELAAVRVFLRGDLDGFVADPLTDWIFTLPADVSPDAVAKAWEAQCAAL